MQELVESRLVTDLGQVQIALHFGRRGPAGLQGLPQRRRRVRRLAALRRRDPVVVDEVALLPEAAEVALDLRLLEHRPVRRRAGGEGAPGLRLPAEPRQDLPQQGVGLGAPLVSDCAL